MWSSLVRYCAVVCVFSYFVFYLQVLRTLTRTDALLSFRSKKIERWDRCEAVDGTTLGGDVAEPGTSSSDVDWSSVCHVRREGVGPFE